jgi:hypothetical protein
MNLINFYENARRSVGEFHADKFIVKVFFIVQTVSDSDEVYEYYSTNNGLFPWVKMTGP